jgi:hypothetical protein
MSTPEQYRAKAAEYGELAKTAIGPDEAREFQRHERNFTELADNEQWVADHRNRTVHAIGAGEAGQEAPNLIGDATPAVPQ